MSHFVESSETRVYQALSHSGAPFYAFGFTDGQLDWALLLEGGYFFRGYSWSNDGGWVLNLAGLDGRDSILVPIAERGGIVFVGADGRIKPLTDAFKFAANPEDIYEGSIDIARYPELTGINEVFIADRIRNAEQATAPNP